MLINVSRSWILFSFFFVSFMLKLRAQRSLLRQHHSDNILKVCEGEMLKKQGIKSAVHLQQLLSSIICASRLTSSFDLASSLCPSSHLSSRLLQTLRKQLPLLFPLLSLLSFLSSPQSLHHSASPLLPLSFFLFLSSSHKVFRHCVSLVLPLQCPGCITAPSPSNGFPMLRPSYVSRGHVSSLGSITL